LLLSFLDQMDKVELRVENNFSAQVGILDHGSGLNVYGFAG
jgi:hypothetical protein